MGNKGIMESEEKVMKTNFVLTFYKKNGFLIPKCSVFHNTPDTNLSSPHIPTCMLQHICANKNQNRHCSRDFDYIKVLVYSAFDCFDCFDCLSSDTTDDILPLCTANETSCFLFPQITNNNNNNK
jgi:hypothetical protein